MKLINSKDINSQRFEKAAFGYKQEEVDEFLSEISSDYEKLVKENEELNKKLQVLADKVREYREDEEAVKDALLLAQKEGRRIVRESKLKADELISDAEIKAKNVVETAAEDAKIQIAELKAQVEAEKEVLAYTQKEVSDFKESLFDIYKLHLEMISEMPDYNEDDEADEDDSDSDEQYNTEELEEEENSGSDSGKEKVK
ncbi:MAG TPA: cell division initiation protein [Ruminococcus sp.]|nr:cell division initiation protein [Ruminococcus sp.]HBN11795.1 cell division initiation protein [Ruminococcus sp.]HCR74717.1 cell division initiation protein [Ruminococcus sp.]